MGLGPTATVGFLDKDGRWKPVTASRGLPIAGGGGGGTDLTSYDQVSSLPDYPDTFPPDTSGISGENIPLQDGSSQSIMQTFHIFSGLVEDLQEGKADTDSLSDVATSGSYNDLDDTPTEAVLDTVGLVQGVFIESGGTVPADLPEYALVIELDN